jgi:alpha-tubulin suppressor-like RCC1 family protein
LGSNSNGALGIDTFGGYYSTPQSVSVAGVTKVSGDFNHTCVIGTAGAVRCWGLNTDGQVGDGTTTDRSSPVAETGPPDGATDVDAGLNRTCAVVGGDVWCWGYLVGTSPVQVTGISTGVDVAVNNNHQ